MSEFTLAYIAVILYTCLWWITMYINMSVKTKKCATWTTFLPQNSSTLCDIWKDFTTRACPLGVTKDFDVKKHEGGQTILVACGIWPINKHYINFTYLFNDFLSHWIMNRKECIRKKSWPNYGRCVLKLMWILKTLLSGVWPSVVCCYITDILVEHAASAFMVEK